MTDQQKIVNLLQIGLEPEQPQPEPLIYRPNGTYLCGCPWVGQFIPHFCPVHPGAFVVFEIRDPQS